MQGARYEGNAQAQSTNPRSPPNCRPAAPALSPRRRAGAPFPLPEPDFNLEPQAQILWRHVSFDPANDGLRTVDLGSISGTTSRLGYAASGRCPMPMAASGSPRPRQRLGRRTDVSFSNSPFQVPPIEHVRRLEFAGGLTDKMNPIWSFRRVISSRSAVAAMSNARTSRAMSACASSVSRARPTPPVTRSAGRAGAG